jgi:transposase-like protein
MAEAQPEKLDGVIEMDETYVGGKMLGRGSKAAKAEKEIVIGIRQRNGDLRFFHAEDARSGTLEKYIRENVSTDVDVIVTDTLHAYHNAIDNAIGRPAHKTVNHTAKEYARYENGLCITTNTVESAFSLLKRGIMGTWHRLSAKHLAAYLDEMTWRFNNRKNPYLFRDTMLKLIHSDNLEYKELTAA